MTLTRCQAIAIVVLLGVLRMPTPGARAADDAWLEVVPGVLLERVSMRLCPG